MNKRVTHHMIGYLMVAGLLSVVAVASRAAESKPKDSKQFADSNEHEEKVVKMATFEQDAETSEFQLSEEIKKLKGRAQRLAEEKDGLHALNATDYGAAKAIFDKALESPDSQGNSRLYSNRGIANLQLGNFKEAHADFDRAITLLEDIQKRVRLALDLKLKFDGELLDLKAINKAIANSYLSRGLAAASLMRHEDALADYGKANKLLPQARILRSESKSLIALRRYKEAAEMYDAAVKQDPKLKLPVDEKTICRVLISEGLKISACE